MGLDIIISGTNSHVRGGESSGLWNTKITANITKIGTQNNNSTFVLVSI